MLSSLADVLSECEDVVVARMIPGEYPEMPSLEIERAIRGDLSGIVQPQKGLGYPPLLTDSSFDHSNRIGWIAWVEVIYGPDFGFEN